MDNSQINSGTGDVIRDIDRGGVKTQVTQLDIGGAAGESLVTGVMPTAQKEQSGTATKLTVDELSGELLTTDAQVLQELQELKLLMQDLLMLMHQVFNI